MILSYNVTIRIGPRNPLPSQLFSASPLGPNLVRRIEQKDNLRLLNLEIILDANSEECLNKLAVVMQAHNEMKNLQSSVRQKYNEATINETRLLAKIKKASNGDTILKFYLFYILVSKYRETDWTKKNLKRLK